jgi:hypothetical protein
MDQQVNGTQHRPWPGPAGYDPERKIRELCDADQRQLHPTTKALAAAVVAGQPVPDPYRQRNQFSAVVEAARICLQDEPSAQSIRAAGHRLSTAIAQLADEMAKEDD